jgi:hypothetical protein
MRQPPPSAAAPHPAMDPPPDMRGKPESARKSEFPAGKTSLNGQAFARGRAANTPE